MKLENSHFPKGLLKPFIYCLIYVICKLFYVKLSSCEALNCV